MVEVMSKVALPHAWFRRFGFGKIGSLAATPLRDSPAPTSGELHLREHLRLSYLDTPRAIPSIPSVLRFRSQLHQPCLRLLRPLLTSRSGSAPSPFQGKRAAVASLVDGSSRPRSRA